MPRRRSVALAAGALAAPLAALLIATALPASGSSPTGSLTMGPQAMEGNLVVVPGTTLSAGYDLTIPGSHPATTITLESPQVAFQGTCVGGGAQVSFTVAMPTAAYPVAANEGDWLPSGDQHSALVYEGQVAVPDLCSGGAIDLAHGGTFTTTVESTATVPGDGVHVRWHYSANGSSGSWSGTAHVQPAPGGGGGGSTG